MKKSKTSNNRFNLSQCPVMIPAEYCRRNHARAFRRLSVCYVDPPGRGEEKGKSNFVNLGLLLVFLNGSKKFYRKSNLQTNEFSNSNSCCFNKTVIQYFAFGEEIKSLMLRKLNCNF